MTAKPRGRPWANVVNPANIAKIATASAIEVSFRRGEIEIRLNANAMMKSSQMVQMVEMASPRALATRGSRLRRRTGRIRLLAPSVEM